jgi:[acyl-carrier-protein] S-malonyltransferase
VNGVAAMVGGRPIRVEEVDAREAALRAGPTASGLPRAGTREGRQLRRWLTQVLAAERVVASEATVSGVRSDDAPAEDELLPDVSARLEIGSIAAAVLAGPLARALFVHVTAEVDVSDEDVAGYHARNPLRFAARPRADGWRTPDSASAFDEVRPVIAAHLRAAERRRAFRLWLDARLAVLVELSAGYEHPGNPRQPDNTHRH